jgi:energy-converting hydrogenase A subunit M
VKIIIGIFQNKEDVTNFYKYRMLDITSLTEVGPFFSKNQALSWMNELHGKIENSEVALIPEGGDNNLKWYGFTFEE